MKDLEIFLEILNTPPPFSSRDGDDDRAACERLWDEFDEAKKEELAGVSYAYWIVRSRAGDHIPAGARQNSAMKEIRRHYIGESRNYARTLAVIREALEHRRRYRFDIVRSCCFEDQSYDNDSDAELAKKYRSFIVSDLETQPMVVRGVDADRRTIIYKPPRNSPGDAEGFMVTQIYTAERAMATSEFESRAGEEKLTVVFSFRDYSSKNSPSTSTMITLATLMQRCYPERLGVLIVADPPFWMRVIFKVVWPVLSTDTVNKIKMPSGQAAIEEEFSRVAKGNKELEGMLSSGDISSIDVTDYVRKPFYSQYK
ncbi:unnamed protein product [Pseudo-nitzschia multistriata]|uniref:CRAL-TRIO domain-containing protein n=1 Tax=Pseudo-nitzschia multistriata TaxID=183589 RepID=A0A448ZEU5_9STRA|nr:unnamed protein product [Pseudo-nitzschia multistriata]